MSKLLYVISSPRGSQSDSSQLAERFLEAYRAHRPGLEVDRLDLWHDQLPVYGGAGVDAKMTLIAGGRLEGDQRQAWQEVRQVFERFDAADEYLFAVPMWNAGIPWVLKHLIDTISQPGMMFGFDPTDGYTGLLQGKRAVVAYTSAVYAPARHKASVPTRSPRSDSRRRRCRPITKPSAAVRSVKRPSWACVWR